MLNISSMAGENKSARMASYGSSKAAVSHLTRNIAFDLGPKNIRVNAIAPGAIRTQALATVLTPDIEKAMLKLTPLGRLGQAENIANAALFLCAPASINARIVAKAKNLSTLGVFTCAFATALGAGR